MKRMIVVLLSCLIVSSLAFARGGGPGDPASAGCGLPAVVAELPYEEISAAEREDILFMLEEEKLARDVYRAMDDAWGLRVFRNISQAEQAHMDGVMALVEKYGLPDPTAGNADGVFVNTDLQALFDQLVANGQRSINDALIVGATIEDLDIFDLQQALPEADNADIQTVFQNLMKGSRNHLRSFDSLLDANGIDYEPQYLSPVDFESIVDSPRERGMLDANGEPDPSCSPKGGRGGRGGRGRR